MPPADPLLNAEFLKYVVDKWTIYINNLDSQSLDWDEGETATKTDNFGHAWSKYARIFYSNWLKKGNFSDFDKAVEACAKAAAQEVAKKAATGNGKIKKHHFKDVCSELEKHIFVVNEPPGGYICSPK